MGVELVNSSYAVFLLERVDDRASVRVLTGRAAHSYFHDPHLRADATTGLHSITSSRAHCRIQTLRFMMFVACRAQTLLCL